VIKIEVDNYSNSSFRGEYYSALVVLGFSCLLGDLVLAVNGILYSIWRLSDWCASSNVDLEFRCVVAGPFFMVVVLVVGE
jgi:hypothetical protein